MEAFLQQLSQLLGTYLPRIFAALLILILGWLIALAIAALVRKVLKRTTFDNRIADWLRGEGERPKPYRVEESVAKVFFYLVMIFVVIAFFQVLGITAITEPLSGMLNQIFQYLPQLFGAIILGLVAWFIAKVVKILVSKGLKAANIDRHLTTRTGVEEGNIRLSDTISEVAFWLVLLLFLPAILSTLELEGLLTPAAGMVGRMLEFLPNIFTAAVILLVGWLVARIVQRIVSNLLKSFGTDTITERVGVESVVGRRSLSDLIGLVVYILILIPIILAALNTLQLQALTAPVSNMLEMIILALPRIFAAILILVFAYIVGKLLAELVSRVLAGVGFNNILYHMGIYRLGIGLPTEEKWMPSAVAGYLVLIGIMLFAFMEAFNQLGFMELAVLTRQLLVLAGRILLGLIVFAIGIFLANLAARAILSTGAAQARLLAATARIAIIILAGAMGLQQMGIADDIINLAFGLLLGAIALAAAIAFGIGGREVAGRELENWVQSIKKRRQEGAD
jgi:hypothetical protein